MCSGSYERHQLEEQDLAARDALPACYTKPNSIGNWHHERMLWTLLPLLAHCKDTTWVTVGDGRFGSEAHFIKKHVKSATATSISDSTLRIAKARDWIDGYSQENVEHLSFSDNAFDYVLCKETYHHFPRPAIGFYEMLRVAKQAVVLIEPTDGRSSPLLSVKRAVKKFLRRDHSYDLFEPSGNFVHRLNISETAKALTSLGHRTLAWKGINTFWYAPFDTGEKHSRSVAWFGSQAAIRAQDVACKLGLLSHGLATVICFKEQPEKSVLSDLAANGFRVQTLPKNPYI